MAIQTSRAHPTKELTVLLAAIPNASNTAVSTVDTFLEQAYFANNNAGAQTVTVTNTAGTVVIPTISIPGNSATLVNWPSLLYCAAGVKWQAGGTGLTGELFGYIRGS